MSKRKLLI